MPSAPRARALVCTLFHRAYRPECHFSLPSVSLGPFPNLLIPERRTVWWVSFHEWYTSGHPRSAIPWVIRPRTALAVSPLVGAKGKEVFRLRLLS